MSIVEMAREDLQKKWWGFLTLGVVLVILGMAALSWTFLFTIASVVFFGVLLIVGGVLQAAHAFWRRQWSGFLLELLTGVLYFVIGLMFVANPAASAEALTLLIALSLLFSGGFRIAAYFSSRFDHGIWLLLHGIVTLLLGISIWISWPMSGLWVIGLFIAIDLLLNGWTLIMLGLALKSWRPA